MLENYFSFCNELRLMVGKYKPGEVVDLVFIVPMPNSWSAKRKALMNTKPHQQRPDVDNLCKSFLDALCKDDSYVYDLHAVKLWGYEGEIDILNYS